MTQTQAISQDLAKPGTAAPGTATHEARGNPIGRFIAFLHGIASYVAFFAAFLYAIGFVSDLVVPKTIDSGIVGPMAEGFIVNLLLLSVFAVQHSVMARKPFKQWWTQFVPASVERSNYV